MSLVIRRADGTEQPVSGYEFAQEKLSDAKTWQPPLGKTQTPPPKVDLRPLMTAIEDQQHTSSCVANAVAGAYEYLVKRHKNTDYDVSRLFIYFNARAHQAALPDAIQDRGSYIADAIKGLNQFGACSESTWPFDANNVNQKPADAAYKEASQFIVEDIAKIPTDLNAWKSCLADGYPIIFGLALFNSFDAHRKPGLVPAPTPQELNRDSHSGHAMLCVGYSDHDQVFIVRNSWGSTWGDNGYCYIPYHYLINPQFNCGDSWIIRQLKNLDIDHITWGDNSSVIQDLRAELADMSETQFSQLLDAMSPHPLEYRIAQLFLFAAHADAHVSDEELSELSEYLGDVLKALGVKLKPKKILQNAQTDLTNKPLALQTISLLNLHLSKAALAGLLSRLTAVISADSLSPEEETFLNQIVQTWQITRPPAPEIHELRAKTKEKKKEKDKKKKDKKEKGPDKDKDKIKDKDKDKTKDKDKDKTKDKDKDKDKKKDKDRDEPHAEDKKKDKDKDKEKDKKKDKKKDKDEDA